jgi:hypothetical protein
MGVRTQSGISPQMTFSAALTSQTATAVSLLPRTAAGVESRLQRGNPGILAKFAAIRRASSCGPGCRAYLANDIPTENYFAAKYCAGIIDELVGAEQGICLPASSTQQAARLVVKYIDARPARLRESFQKLAREALRAAFPCKH